MVAKIIAVKVQNYTYSYVLNISTGLPQQNSRLHDITIQGGFGLQIAKTPIYPVICPFTLLVALHDYNQLLYEWTSQCYRRTDGRTDIMLVAYTALEARDTPCH